MRHQTRSVRRDFYGYPAPIVRHLQGAPPETVCELQQPAECLLRRTVPRPRSPGPHLFDARSGLVRTVRPPLAADEAIDERPLVAVAPYGLAYLVRIGVLCPRKLTPSRQRQTAARRTVRGPALPSGVITMDDRVYVPQIGRFLQTDPIRGAEPAAAERRRAAVRSLPRGPH